MSDNLAIAATTAALAQVLSGPLVAVVPGAQVTTLPPASPALATGEPIANLHLLAAEPASVPRAPPRRGIGPAPLLLRLTYFVSCHGDDSGRVPQKLMGAVTAALHAQPVLTPTLLAAALGQTELAGAELASVAESLRVSPVGLGAERMAGLAAALGAPGLTGLVYEISPVPL